MEVLRYTAGFRYKLLTDLLIKGCSFSRIAKLCFAFKLATDPGQFYESIRKLNL